MAIFIRSLSPPPFADYRKYLGFLRADFLYRCAYCERSEAYLGGADFFEIDHFRPESKFPSLRNDYPNLYYCCGKCNRYKGNTWPSNRLEDLGFRFADPCSEDMYKDHFQEGRDGRLHTLTPCGHYTQAHIRLNRPDLLAWRQRQRKAESDLSTFIALKEQLELLMGTVTEPSQKSDLEEKLSALESWISGARQRFNF